MYDEGVEGVCGVCVVCEQEVWARGRTGERRATHNENMTDQRTTVEFPPLIGERIAMCVSCVQHPPYL